MKYGQFKYGAGVLYGDGGLPAEPHILVLHTEQMVFVATPHVLELHTEQRVAAPTPFVGTITLSVQSRPVQISAITQPGGAVVDSGGTSIDSVDRATVTDIQGNKVSIEIL